MAQTFMPRLTRLLAFPSRNHGDMRRDFTFVDDIVAGVLAAIDRPPAAVDGSPCHRRYNLGNHRPEALLDFIGMIAKSCGQKKQPWTCCLCSPATFTKPVPI